MDQTKIQATLLAQEIWKHKDARGTVKTNGLIFKLSHGQVVKLKNGQDDISKLPSIKFSIVKKDQHVEHVKSGDVFVKMSYSGEIVTAYGDVAEDGQQSRYDLTPEEALKVAQEVWRTVQTAQTTTA